MGEREANGEQERSVPRSGFAASIFMSQESFDAWADVTRPRFLALTGAALLVLAVTTCAAVAVMGPRLAREGSLLWFGARADGVVRQVKFEEVGKFKGGDPRYRLTIDYRFIAADGAEYPGTTLRGDVRTRPAFGPGDGIGVYYETGNPANSLAEHNLRTDVYALVLFLPFLAVIGIGGPLWYLRRLWSWRRRRARVVSSS